MYAMSVQLQVYCEAVENIERSLVPGFSSVNPRAHGFLLAAMQTCQTPRALGSVFAGPQHAEAILRNPINLGLIAAIQQYCESGVTAKVQVEFFQDMQCRQYQIRLTAQVTAAHTVPFLPKGEPSPRTETPPSVAPPAERRLNFRGLKSISN